MQFINFLAKNRFCFVMTFTYVLLCTDFAPDCCLVSHHYVSFLSFLEWFIISMEWHSYRVIRLISFVHFCGAYCRVSVLLTRQSIVHCSSVQAVCWLLVWSWTKKTVILSLCYKLIMSISAAKAIILSICNFNIPRLDSSPRPPVLGEMGKCPKFCLKIWWCPHLVSCCSWTAQHMKTGKYCFKRGIIALHFGEKYAKLNSL